MVKKTYTFKDYNGNERTEEYYFNLTETETIKLEMGVDGGLTEKIRRIIAARDIPEIINVFDELIGCSYGVKSPDGREFIKSPELTKSFMQTEGYNLLFKDFMTKEGFAAEFFKALIPQGTVEMVENLPEYNTTDLNATE